jgi:citrate synthase
MSEIKTEKWKTAITDIKPNKVLLRGYPIDKLMGKISYAGGVYLALRGELPGEKIEKVINAILVSSLDHGVTPPSAISAIIASSTGAQINAAIASGILAINKYHGGAIEDAMRLFYEISEKIKSTEELLEIIVDEYLANLRKEKKRVMGFGHRIHTDDPRARKLFSICDELDVAQDYVKIAKMVEKKLSEQIGRNLPINVDGAIAAVLCGLDFEPEVANAFFIMARIPGLVAHIQEERRREKPMRKINPSEWEYDGPAERDVE